MSAVDSVRKGHQAAEKQLFRISSSGDRRGTNLRCAVVRVCVCVCLCVLLVLVFVLVFVFVLAVVQCSSLWCV